jgi:two-component system response regulator VicR
MARVAIVDDDAEIIELLRMVLEDEGYEVATYSESATAYLRLRSLQPDLILLDLRMEQPGSGWTLLDRLCRDASTAAIPVILCSADGMQVHERHEWLQEHGIPVLDKPFDLDIFLNLVAAQLGGTPTTTGAGGA